MFLRKLHSSLNPPLLIPRIIKINLSPASSTATAEAKPSIAVDPDEIEHHGNLSNVWWDPNGPLAALHSMNTIRVPFIRDGLIATNRINPKYINTPKVFTGLEILDIGCGGGLLTEQLGRLNANVTGIDLSDELIKVAKKHLKCGSPELLDCINYKVEPIEIHMKHNQEKYDAVVLSEVLEHVSDKAGILTAATSTLKPGGSIFITSINKTFPAWLSTVLVAEYFINIVPKGTHHYDKLTDVIEIQRILNALNCSTILINGFTYNFWNDTWKWIPTTQLSFALQAVKND